jgi:hypothetical protein
VARDREAARGQAQQRVYHPECWVRCGIASGADTRTLVSTT